MEDNLTPEITAPETEKEYLDDNTYLIELPVKFRMKDNDTLIAEIQINEFEIK